MSIKLQSMEGFDERIKTTIKRTYRMCLLRQHKLLGSTRHSVIFISDYYKAEYLVFRHTPLRFASLLKVLQSTVLDSIPYPLSQIDTVLLLLANAPVDGYAVRFDPLGSNLSYPSTQKSSLASGTLTLTSGGRLRLIRLLQVPCHVCSARRAAFLFRSFV